jgi:sugar diacid utilization regulator
MTSAWGDRSDALRLIVDELAEQLGRSVVVDDALVRQLYASRHFDDADPARMRAMLQHDAGAEVVAYVLGQGIARWSGPGRIPAAPELNLLPRLCVPLRAHGEFLGMIMVIDADISLTDGEIEVIDEAATAIATQMSALALASDTSRTERAEALRRIVSADSRDRETAAARLRELGLSDRPHLVMTVIEVASPLHNSAQIELALRTAQAPIENAARTRGIGAVRGRNADVLQQWLSPVTPDQLREQAQRIRQSLRRALGDASHTVVGVGAAVPGLSSIRDSHRQAEVALRAAHRLPHLDRIALWTDLGEYAPLLCITDDVPPDSRAAQALRALAAQESGPRLRDTLRTYLDEAGSAPRTARALHLHRTSLYYRLTQIQEITGMDLESGSDRLALHLQLRLDEITPPAG